jgi:hypothetical protein
MGLGLNDFYQIYVRMEVHGSVVVAGLMDDNGVGDNPDEKCYRST